MARFSPEQIYAFARRAGFSPDQAAAMMALALAERGQDETNDEESRVPRFQPDAPIVTPDVEFGILPGGVPVAPAEAEYAHPFDVGGVVSD